MKSHPRIDKSAFRRGEYIGYCNGAQRIRRCGNGWQTYGLASSAGEAVFATAPTLQALGDRLEKMANLDKRLTNVLQHHVTGAIERGEAVAIVAQE